MVKIWNFWDTLVTRCVLQPVDIFEIIERVSGVTGFARARIIAETKSRTGVIETNLQHIYKELPYDEEIRFKLIKLELELEHKLTSPIIENTSKLSSQDIIISDMYLGQDHLRSIADSCGITIDKNKLFVSCEHGATKHDGELYKIIKAMSPIETHVGDNLRSDVKKARERGINAEHYQNIAPNKIEKIWCNRGGDSHFIGGLLRSARLSSANADNNKHDEWEVFSQIIAPVLVHFVSWVLSESIKKGIRKIYFLSRDGQILCKIARCLSESRGLDIRCEYLYASRQALHLPGHTFIEESEEWILDNTSHLSIQTVAHRVGLSADLISKISAKYFNATIDENLTLYKREVLKSIIRDPEFIRSLENESSLMLKSAILYFQQSGIMQEKQISIVDVGWNGRMQRSLENIFKKNGTSEVAIQGFYLGLAKNCVYSSGERIQGFLNDPFNPGSQKPWVDRYRGMFEFFLAADHPAVAGYSVDDKGKIGPHFKTMVSNEERKNVEHRQAAILSFVDRYCTLEKLLGNEFIEQLDYSVELLEKLLTNPSKKQASVFAQYSHTEQQVESNFEPLVKKVRVVDLISNKRGRNLGIWPEGSCAFSRLGWLHQFYRFVSRIKRKLLF